MNTVIMMGRLTKDIELRYSNGDTPTAIGRFTLAVDAPIKAGQERKADFFNCTAFGKTAETLEKYVKKGGKIAIQGRLQNDNYTNKEGQKVYSVQIIVSSFEFCEKIQQTQQAQSVPVAAPSDAFMPIPDDMADEELPFNF